MGIAVLEPDAATVRKDKPFDLSYLWRVPPQQNWHDLKTLDLRVVERDNDDKGPHHGSNDEAHLNKLYALIDRICITPQRVDEVSMTARIVGRLYAWQLEEVDES